MLSQVKYLAREVYSILGNSQLEHVYRNALSYELTRNGIYHNMEVVVPINYKGHQVGYGRADIIIGNDIILELKAVSTKPKINERNQILNYMRMTGIHNGCIINFNKNGSSPDFLDVTLPTEPINMNPNKVITISDLKKIVEL